MTTLLPLVILWLNGWTLNISDLPSNSGNMLRTQMMQQINSIRTKGCRCGNDLLPPAPPLRWNEQLAKAARRHVTDMSAHAHFHHTGTDGSSTAQRVEEAGYRFRLIGENIAYGHPSLKSVIENWIESPGHCKNMMNPAYREMGAAAKNGYWVQTLGISY